MLSISLSGTFRVTDCDGNDVTPKSAKARGLLAILALSKDMRRSRVWLRGKLWSTSGTAQGSDSLRQCLTEVRRALGPGEALVTDRRSVALDPDQVEIRMPAADGDAARELCTDIDVADPEFLTWIRGMRARHAGSDCQIPALIDRPADRAAVVVVMSLAHEVPEEVLWVYQSLREAIALLLREGGNIHVVNERDPVPGNARDGARYFFVVFDISAVAGQAVISTRIESGVDGRTLWNSGQKWLANDGSDKTIWELNKLAFWTHEETAGALADAHGERDGSKNAYALAIRGRNRMFEFSRESLKDADRLLAAAYQIEPQGSFLAWRHFLRNTATIEHLSDDFLEPINRLDLMEQAVIDGSTNSFVLAVASQDALGRQNDLSLAKALVDDALERNPVNPLGLGFLSNIYTLSGDYDLSIQAAERAQSLVQNQSYRGFWSMFLCMSHMAQGDYEKAAFHANMAHYLMPRLLAAQRFLYALNEALGRESQALTVMRKIRKREPDFSKQHLFRSDYPSRTMRRTRILDLLS